MKKILFFAAILLIGCNTKETFAPIQSNGLNYKFVSFIGPDSCKLYKCAFEEPYHGNTQANFVYLTVCGNKPNNTSWQSKSGKSTITISNALVFDTVITISNALVFDTVITIHK